MKKYKVHISKRFEFLQLGIFQYIYEYSPKNAFVVLEAVAEVIDGLEYMPERYQIAREVEEDEELVGLNLRQAIVKNHRVVFLIDDDTVYVAVSCRQKTLPAEDILLGNQ